MKVKDFEVKGNSAKEVLEGITEEHTNAKVSRISEGLYNVHLELKEEQPASYVPKGWSICRRAGANMYACVYKRGSLVYKLASDTCVVFSSDNLRITPIMKGE